MMTRLVGTCAALIIALCNVHADADLPRVLILADQVHVNTARTVASELQGRAKVVVPSVALADTGTTLAQLDELLGDGEWDLIQFNFGFADLRHIAPGTKSVRIMSRHHGGIPATSPEMYEANLRKIVARLKETKAHLIWASTTPIVGTKYDHIFESGSEKGYNSIAAKIMLEEKIPVNDLHAWVLGNVEKFTDPFAFQRVPIQEPIRESIEKVLKLSPKPHAEEKQK